jgi:hypothetical protein
MESDRVINKPAPKRKKELSYCPVSGEALPAGSEVLVETSMLLTYMQGIARKRPVPPEVVKYSREAEELNEHAKLDVVMDSSNQKANRSGQNQHQQTQNQDKRISDKEKADAKNAGAEMSKHARSTHAGSRGVSGAHDQAHVTNNNHRPANVSTSYIDEQVTALLTIDGKKRTSAAVDKEVVDLIKRAIFSRENSIPAMQEQRLRDVINHVRVREHQIAVSEDVALRASQVAMEDSQRAGRSMINLDLSHTDKNTMQMETHTTTESRNLMNNTANKHGKYGNHGDTNAVATQIAMPTSANNNNNTNNTHAKGTPAGVPPTGTSARRPSGLSACRVVEVRNITVLEDADKVTAAATGTATATKGLWGKNRAQSAPTYFTSSRLVSANHERMFAGDETVLAAAASSSSRIMAFRRMRFAAAGQKNQDSGLQNGNDYHDASSHRNAISGTEPGQKVEVRALNSSMHIGDVSLGSTIHTDDYAVHTHKEDYTRKSNAHTHMRDARMGTRSASARITTTTSGGKEHRPGTAVMSDAVRGTSGLGSARAGMGSRHQGSTAPGRNLSAWRSGNNSRVTKEITEVSTCGYVCVCACGLN